MAEHSNTNHTEVPADGHKAVFPPFDSSKFEAQLVWLAITFIILYVIISRMALPRIGEVLEERQDRIQKDIDEANRLKEETDKAIATYEEALASARQKANKIADETRAKLKSEINSEQKAVEDKIAKKTADAEKRIGEAKEQAFGEVKNIAQSTTSLIVEKLLGTKPSDSDIEQALK